MQQPGPSQQVIDIGENMGLCEPDAVDALRIVSSNIGLPLCDSMAVFLQSCADIWTQLAGFSRNYAKATT
jgi:hypothetical protein